MNEMAINDIIKDLTNETFDMCYTFNENYIGNINIDKAVHIVVGSMDFNEIMESIKKLFITEILYNNQQNNLYEKFNEHFTFIFQHEYYHQAGQFLFYDINKNIELIVQVMNSVTDANLYILL
jgi:hypothetical protein